MKRSAWLPTRTALKRRTPLARESAKRRSERVQRAAVRAEVLGRANYACEAVGIVAHHCEGPVDVHEVVPRSAWPGGHLVVANCRALCRVAHDWAHNHPLAAIECGLLQRRWES